MPSREPYAWSAGLVAIWIIAVIVIVAAAGGEDPAVEAGTVVFGLPLIAFAANLVSGLRGRGLGWAVRFAITAGIILGIGYLVAMLVRWEPGAIYLVPIIAFVAGFVLWIVSGAGWLIGAVVRTGLGRGGDGQDDTLDPGRL